MRKIFFILILHSNHSNGRRLSTDITLELNQLSPIIEEDENGEGERRGKREGGGRDHSPESDIGTDEWTN